MSLAYSPVAAQLQSIRSMSINSFRFSWEENKSGEETCMGESKETNVKRGGKVSKHLLFYQLLDYCHQLFMETILLGQYNICFPV